MADSDDPYLTTLHAQMIAAAAAAFWHPARVRARQQAAEKLLREARQAVGYLKFRLQPQICRRGRPRFAFLRGESLYVIVPEPVDLWDFWADLKRFAKAWRPSRLRNAGQQTAVEQAWTLWERQ